MTDNDGMTQSQQPASSTSWEILNPTSFKNTIYIPSLKISVTAGSFVKYRRSVDGSPHVGRVVDVVT